ncbi:IucA/IucC family C-terminal-domain containing protein [Bacillus sp. B-jedd]|uniref:IucA/IucC family C-terminal-domain containing protein n=1 Tax=Bacillus sp. B-jedd TaxID=1476857 RepID=UPI0005155785|nr:IucA/IucC family C-terminal-domain containing protein [Bacillus sp. B-jedd]CEG28843.1 putative ferric iron reductase protein [Bacillus sp. B-jedd]
MKIKTSALTEQEKNILSQYRFSNQPMEGMISAASLLDPVRLETFIGELKTTFQTEFDKVVASVFIKRYAFLAVIALYSMSAWNKKLDLDPENIFIEPPNGDAKWLPKFYFASTETEEGQSAGTSGNRGLENGMQPESGKPVTKLGLRTETPVNNSEPGSEPQAGFRGVGLIEQQGNPGSVVRRKAFLPNEKVFREEVLSGLFAGHINPLVNRLAKVSGVSKLILWENIGVYIMWLYETVLENDRELDFIFNEAGGELFGSYHRNPMKKFYTGKTYVDDLDEMVRIRQTCCFSYLTGEKAARCKTCPCRKLEMEGKCSNGPENVCDAVRSLT